ncbi:MAG: dihydroorotase [Bacilli bacterium]
MILRNCKVLDGNNLVIRDIKIKNKVIELIDKNIDNDDFCLEYDLKNKLVSPAFIDMHVHLREPGFEQKETIKTGTKSGACGGYSLICAMPNTNPIIDNESTINKFNEIVKRDAIIKVKTYSAITKGFDNELVDFSINAKNTCGFSNDGVGVQTAGVMYEAMQEVAKNESLISAHCEDESLLYKGYVHAGKKALQENWKGILSISESVQVARDMLLSNATGCRYHVCHISTKESVNIVASAKKNSNKISCEVTPHHLLLTENDVKNSNYKMNPPLRSIEDRDALIKGLLDGTIEVIATDHAPHTIAEKSQSIDKAPFGIVGLETAFALIYTNFVKTNRATIKQCIEWFSVNPAKILNLGYGHLEIGRVADLVVIDEETAREININKSYSKGRNSPFDKVVCYGYPVMTIVDGKVIYDYERNYIKGD